MTSTFPRVNKRVLGVFTLVGILMLGVGVALVLATGQTKLRDSYGRHLSQVAQQVASAVDGYVYRALLDVRELGRSPSLRQAVASANQRSLDMAAVRRLDEVWQAPGPLPAEAAVVLKNPAAEFLADLSQDPIYIEFLLTDAHGRLVAASGRVSDYYQADEDWWLAAFDDGRLGRLTTTGVRWDESARRYAIEISTPVPSPGTDELGGILKVVADSRELLALVGGLRLGGTGQAMLLLDDGTVVFSREVRDPNARFFASDEARDRTAALREGGPSATAFFRAAGPDGEMFVVGLAPSQLVSTYPNLPWVVAVMQSEDELLAPVQPLGWYLLAVLALSVMAVLVFALWFSMRIAAPPIAADLQLAEHAPVMHVGATDEPILGEKDKT
ncbi:MAG TPA: cache domain-containing protein [Vicinamibacterales bacterium]|nr:cache domain-containing protein [Vicinamibacterales bacterium]